MWNKIKAWLLGMPARQLQPQTPTEPQKTLSDALSAYSVVDVVEGTDEHGPFVIVTPKTETSVKSLGGLSFVNPHRLEQPPTDHSWLETEPIGNVPTSLSVVPPKAASGGSVKLKEKPDLGELASSSPSPFVGGLRSEYNQQLKGLNGLRIYDQMRKSNGVIAGVLLAVKTPVYAGNWRVDSASGSKRDKNIAQFVEKCLFEYQSISWTQILIDSMLSAEFGYMIFEKVWEIRTIQGKQRAVLKKLAPRHPMDVKEVKYDKHGGPKAVIFFVKNDIGTMDEVTIDIDKLLIVTNQREVGDVQGRSVLRPAYQHYYYNSQLYKIDAIQKERHGIGIPLIKLPVGFTDQDRTDANALGRNLRTNERAHIVLPPNWEIEFAKLEGQPVDCMKSIEYHDNAIRESVLAGFTGSEKTTNEEDLGLFLKATRFIANSICDAFNMYLIEDIVKYNYDNITEMPKLKVRQIGEQADNRTMSFTVRNMVGAGIIRPDDVLENYIRELLDLPPVDLATVRVVKAPQAGQGPGTMPNATPGTNTPLPGQPPKPGEQPGQPQPGGKENPVANKPGLPRQTPLPNVGVGGSKVGDNKGQA